MRDEYADYLWLVSRGGAEHLAGAAASQLPLHRLTATLRRDLSPHRAHLVLEQIELRRRGEAKFAQAADMFFTPKGLEQATDQWIAAYKATRLPQHEPVIDLCCGVGGDLMAFARRGPVLGVDQDAVAVLLARENLRGITGSSRGKSGVQCTDARHVRIDDCSAWHIDPDRRPQGRRTTRVALHQPGPDVIERLLETNGSAAIKLAPAATLPEGWEARAELEWISWQGECRQLVAWFGPLGRAEGIRSATVLRGRAGDARTFSASRQTPQPPTESLQRYVYEPDAALRAASLSSNLASEQGLTRLDSTGYYTSDALVDERAFDAFEVQELLPLNVKRLASLARARQIGRVEIKARYAPVDPEKLRRELRLLGDHSATLLVCKLQGRMMAILAQRCQRL